MTATVERVDGPVSGTVVVTVASRAIGNSTTTRSGSSETNRTPTAAAYR